MTAAVAPSGRFDVGRVISAGFALVRHQAFPLLILAFVFGFLPAIAESWAMNHWASNPSAETSASLGATFGRLGVTQCISYVSGGFRWVFQGGVAVIATADLAGRSADLPSLLVKSAARAPLVFLLGIIGTIGVVLGILLLIIPGVLLALAWCLCPAVGAVETVGFLGVFRRSADLTRGNRGTLFVVYLLFDIASSAIILVRPAFGVPLLATGRALPPILIFVVQPAIAAVLELISASVFAAAYLELRKATEGLATNALAATFD
jgi:hypothetical protein